MIETTDFITDSKEQIHQIRMSRAVDGKPVYWVAAYLVDGLLVDTGCSHTAIELGDHLAGRDLRLVVNTHYHEDHVGGNHELMTRFAVDILAHRDALPLIGKRNVLYPYQEFVWGYPVPTQVKSLPVALETPGHTFHVIETPGHSPDHICLVELQTGWCFTGDLFAREHPKFIRPEENIRDIMGSMERILALPCPELILFTSVGKILPQGRKALTDCINYLKRLTDRVKAMTDTGLSVDAMVTHLFGGETPFRDLTGGQFSSGHLVSSIRETLCGGC